MVDFKVSEDESYFFVKTTGDYPLLIAHIIKRPGKPSEQPKIFKGIVEEGQLPYRESAYRYRYPNVAYRNLRNLYLL